MPTASFNVSSAALEASHVLSASPRKMLDLSITNTAGSTRYFLVFDAEFVPTAFTNTQVFTIDFTGLTGADVIGREIVFSFMTLDGDSNPTGVSSAGYYFYDSAGSDPGAPGLATLESGIAVAAAASPSDITQAIEDNSVGYGIQQGIVGAVLTITDNAIGWRPAVVYTGTGAAIDYTAHGNDAPILIGSAAANGIPSFDVPVVGKTFSHGISVVNSTSPSSITGSDATANYSAELLCAAP